MMLIVRIAKVVLIAALGVLAGRWALGLGPELVGPRLSDIADLCVFVAALVLASLTERELFWAAPPKRSGATRHPRISR
jgi:hypothetical protein